MELYFSPLACSLATRIAFYEAGYVARYMQVDTKRKQVLGGGDFFENSEKANFGYGWGSGSPCWSATSQKPAVAISVEV